MLGLEGGSESVVMQPRGSLVWEFCKALASLNGLPARVVLWVEYLQGEDPLESSRFVQDIFVNCNQSQHQKVAADALAFTLLQVGTLPSTVHTRLYEAALATKQKIAARMLTRYPTNRIPLAANSITFPHSSHLSMSHSSSLDTGRIRSDIERMTPDADPRIIRILLNNPALTEKHVLEIADNYQTSSHALYAIASHSKWWSHYPVKRSLTFNPQVPIGIAICTIPLLTKKDLIEIRKDRKLHPLLREQVIELNNIRYTTRTLTSAC